MTGQIGVNLALRVLETLGTADAVAGFFADNGLKGGRGKADYCPVSRYLECVTGLTVHTTSTYIRIHPSDGMDLTLETPYAVCDFIRAFDKGTYPELEVGPS